MPDDTFAPNATGPDSIDLHSDEALQMWARRFDVTTDQVRDAVARVGDKATDVGAHLKAHGKASGSGV